MPKPNVVTGLRQPVDREVDVSGEAVAAPARPETSAVRRSDVTVYESSFPRYRVQLTSPEEIKDPATGRVRRETPLVAQFEDGVYTNAARDPKVRAYVDQMLQENPFFHRGGPGPALSHHFWLQSEADVALQSASAEASRRTIASLPPELKQQLIKEMQESGELDLILPPRARKNAAQPEV